MSEQWKPNLNTQAVIDNFLADWFASIPEILGIDETVSGCEVMNLDPYGVGTLPRYIQVALRGGYRVDAFYRGNIPGLALTDLVTVVHFRDGDRYEVLGAGGATGTAHLAPADAQYVTMAASADLPNERVLTAGEWLGLTDGGAGGNATLDFLPDLPVVYDSTTGTITEYADPQAAIDGAAAGEFVILPPGTYIGCFSLKYDVPVVELFTDTVTLRNAGGLGAWSTYTVRVVDVGTGAAFINVHRIEVDGDYALLDVYAVRCDTDGTLTVIADLYARQRNAGMRSVGLYNNGTGTLYFKGDIETDTDGTGTYGVRNNYTGTIIGKGDVKSDGGADGFVYMIRNNSTGTVKWQGDGDIDTTGSDTFNNYAIGIQNRGGVIEWRGFLDVCAANAEANGIQAYVGGGSIYAVGRVVVYGYDGGINGIVLGHTPDASTCDIKFRGRVEARTTNGAAYGCMMSPVQGNGTIELHADVVAESTNGNAYGVRNDGPGSTMFSNGTVSTVAGGVANDLHQANGALTVSCCEYEHSKVVGTITLSEGDKANNSGGQALITGGGTVALGGFTLTVPATGTVALLEVANTFTLGPQTVETGGVANVGLIVKGAVGQTANLQEWQSSAPVILASVNASGEFIMPRLAVGNTTPIATVWVRVIPTAITAVAGTYSLLQFSVDANPGGASAAHYRGLYGGPNTQLGNAQNFTGSFSGGTFQPRHFGTGTASYFYGIFLNPRLDSAGTITSLNGFYSNPANAGAGTVNYMYGGRIAFSNTGGGTVQRVYGLYIDNVSIGSLLNYAIYTNAGLVRFGDDIVIADAKNIVLATTTGTKIGTATNQKLGFFNATPVTQRTKAAYNNWAALSDVVGALVALGLFDQV